MAQRVCAWWKSEARENFTNHGLFIGTMGAATGLLLVGAAAWTMLGR